MDWAQHKSNWPNAAFSRFVPAGTSGHWHVQEVGTGPQLLLIHGAGGSTHSWRDLLPKLAQTHHVIAVDLPGQGFSVPAQTRRFGLDAMARDLTRLIEAEGWEPVAILGHSAGAAIALRMAEEGWPGLTHVIGINAALGKFPGLAGVLFPIAAKVMAITPLAARLFAERTTKASIARLLGGTGSTLDPAGHALYLAAAQDADHVFGTLRMMAAWSLDGLLNRLPRHPVTTTLIVGENDLTVPPDTSARAVARMPDAKLIEVAGLGHLMHEEDPEAITALIRQILQD